MLQLTKGTFLAVSLTWSTTVRALYSILALSCMGKLVWRETDDIRERWIHVPVVQHESTPQEVSDLSLRTAIVCCDSDVRIF